MDYAQELFVNIDNTQPIHCHDVQVALPAVFRTKRNLVIEKKDFVELDLGEETIPVIIIIIPVQLSPVQWFKLDTKKGHGWFLNHTLRGKEEKRGT